MPDYMAILGQHYPAVEASAEDAANYSTLIHVAGDPLPTQADLDAKDLEDYKATKIDELSAQCALEIVNGFQSTAGGLHTAPGKWYDSMPEDQMNLVGAVTAGDSMPYASRETQDGAKVYMVHTNAQLEAVLRDGRDIKLAKLQTFNTKRAEVNAAADKAAVDAVVW